MIPDLVSTVLVIVIAATLVALGEKATRRWRL